MASGVSFDKETWQKFIKIIDEIGKTCTDVEIQEGKIRQLNNSRTTAYQCDLGVPELSIKLALVKNLIPILKVFTPQNDEDKVDILIEDDSYAIKDKYSTVSVRSPISIQNEYITDDKFNQIGFNTGTDIFKFKMPEIVYSRISVIKNNFSTLTLGIEIKETAALKITSWSKTMKSKLYSNIPLLEKGDEYQKNYVCGTDAFDMPLEGEIDFCFRCTSSGIFIVEVSGVYQDVPITTFIRAMEDDKAPSQSQ